MIPADFDLLFVELAILAYFDEPLAQKWAKSIGFFDARKVHGAGGETLATVFMSEYDTVIAIKGTADVSTVLVDLDLDLTRDGELPGKVHNGFRKLTTETWNSIAPLVANDPSVWIVGHSLGGAIAAIVAIRAARGDGCNAKGIVTFGMPRLGTHAYVSNLATPHKRWVHHHDLVPRIPAKWIGYQHFGKEEYIANGEVLPKTIWNRLKRFLSRLLDRLHLDGIDDHNIINYRAAIIRGQARKS
jgi:hypothetical protein